MQTTAVAMPADSSGSVADDIPNSETKRKGFLDLPAELQIDIYRHAFSTLGSVTPAHTADVLEVRVNLPAQLLACCKTINNEARPIFFEVTDFVLKEPGDLLRLGAVAGQFAAAISRLAFHRSGLLQKTTIEELRPFKLLRAVDFWTPFPGEVTVVPPNSLLPQRELETLAFWSLRGADKYLFELVQQRPDLICTIGVPLVQRIKASGIGFMPDEVHFVARCEVVRSENGVKPRINVITMLKRVKHHAPEE